jgi:hypothetical protein
MQIISSRNGQAQLLGIQRQASTHRDLLSDLPAVVRPMGKCNHRVIGHHSGRIPPRRCVSGIDGQVGHMLGRVGHTRTKDLPYTRHNTHQGWANTLHYWNQVQQPVRLELVANPWPNCTDAAPPEPRHLQTAPLDPAPGPLCRRCTSVPLHNCTA